MQKKLRYCVIYQTIICNSYYFMVRSPPVNFATPDGRDFCHTPCRLCCNFRTSKSGDLYVVQKRQTPEFEALNLWKGWSDTSSSIQIKVIQRMGSPFLSYTRYSIVSVVLINRVQLTVLQHEQAFLCLVFLICEKKT